ncbi:Lrp/AsnC family transcriptional regulator [Aliiroseovarius sp. PTFE2010]|uniref:Lrp/AsnC family transcriptional regulator n=1 Tax=Aliiroseovarius sp. PTFE2010 TaxID=3417190 RepID=UPI003CF20607
MQLDDTDRRILRQLQADPGALPRALSERAGVTPATYQRRVDRMRAAGLIKAFREEVDWAALGYGVEVSLRFTLDKTDSRAFDDFIDAARAVPEVTSIQTFLGRVDVRLFVVARDMPHYQNIYRSKILTLPHIADIEALMHVATIKNAQTVPL